MRQLAFLSPESGQIVNVASVPKRSPFRYPGGKTWLVPKIRQWLLSRPVRPAELIEPFAGGAIVGLTAAFERLTEHVTLVELDRGVAAVWRTILEGDAEGLAGRIAGYELSMENALTTLAAEPTTEMELALHTVLRNRINRGGILAPGAGLIKYGENGRGLTSRW